MGCRDEGLGYRVEGVGCWAEGLGVREEEGVPLDERLELLRKALEPREQQHPHPKRLVDVRGVGF